MKRRQAGAGKLRWRSGDAESRTAAPSPSATSTHWWESQRLLLRQAVVPRAPIWAILRSLRQSPPAGRAAAPDRACGCAHACIAAIVKFAVIIRIVSVRASVVDVHHLRAARTLAIGHSPDKAGT
ncbi:hypothetical protein SAMN05444365_10144 [Micromonospora pattaloongensis]|uniref:Uncharacterized protein n=1 Tax=Micromonospora pattaloongensis TaxID=405436 RepID=A0A1H3FMD1_9ACTN|nr:hypothetical protein SAMN05444365_10144 [Micromonospora pattaloongensis]